MDEPFCILGLIGILVYPAYLEERGKVTWTRLLSGLLVFWIVFHFGFLFQTQSQDSYWQVGGQLLASGVDAVNPYSVYKWAEGWREETGAYPHWSPSCVGMPTVGSLQVAQDYQVTHKVCLMVGANFANIERIEPLQIRRSLWGVLVFSGLSLCNFMGLVMMMFLLPLGLL